MKKNNWFILLKRLFAFCIDILTLGIIGYVICYFLFEPISSMGIWARVIGFTIFVLYFGIMNSNLCNGQTLGKKLANIKVVDVDGNYLNIKKALLRSVILSPVIILNAIPIYIGSPFFYIISELWCVLTLQNLLLFLFYTPTRQVIHDLVVKSYVVNKDVAKVENIDTKIIKISIIFIISILLALSKNFFYDRPFYKDDFSKLNNIIDIDFKNRLIEYKYGKHCFWNGDCAMELILIYNANNIPSKILFSKEFQERTSEIISDQIKNNFKQVKLADILTVKFAKIANIGIAEISHTYTKDVPLLKIY